MLFQDIMLYKYILILLIIFIENSTPVSVIIKSTHFIGSVKIIDGNQVNEFLGIPYAEPPIGSLRFKKPLPVGTKKKVEATEWKPACYQNELFKEMVINKKISEDCLYLNIWSPKTESDRQYENDGLRPVLIWFHGGALISDSASRELYDSQVLASKSDLVVVSVNFRLDIFGFLYTGTEDAPGNLGLWDQALAMEWILDNINYFGGDPKRISIMGQNTGASSVGLHLLSPITRNLFQNAIMISGSALNHLVGEKPEMAKKKWVKAAKSVGCGDGKEWTPDVIACLRRADADKLINISHSSMLGKNDGQDFTPQVIYGDSFLPDEPLVMLSKGDHKKNVNLLIGMTDDEGGLMLPMIDLWKYSISSPKTITKEEASQELIKFSKQLVSKIPINGEDVSKVYISSLPSDDESLIRRTIGVAIGDFYITCPTILFAKSLFKNSNKVKVYQYLWTRKIKDNLNPCAEWMGACHGYDTNMLFGLPFIKKDYYTDEDRDVSQHFIKTLAHFAKHGQPLAQENKEWPNYYIKDDQIIAPFYDFSFSKANKKRIYGKNLRNNECENLWQKYIK